MQIQQVCKLSKRWRGQRGAQQRCLFYASLYLLFPLELFIHLFHFGICIRVLFPLAFFLLPRRIKGGKREVRDIAPPSRGYFPHFIMPPIRTGHRQINCSVSLISSSAQMCVYIYIYDDGPPSSSPSLPASLPVLYTFILPAVQAWQYNLSLMASVVKVNNGNRNLLEPNDQNLVFHILNKVLV